jgi:glutamate 5-kinase
MNRYKKVVVKIGSALITAGGKGLDRAAITAWADQMAQLRADGVDVVLVSSGSIAEGITRLGLKARPRAPLQLARWGWCRPTRPVFRRTAFIARKSC